jgi:PEP-CTERM motif
MRLTTFIFLVTVLAFPVGILAQGRSNSRPVPEQIPQNPKNPVSVPEPTTLMLLGVGAGALALRKIWQARR